MSSPLRAWWRTGAGVVMVCLLALPAGVTIAGAAWAVVQPVGLDYAEAVVYGQAMRIVAGQPLYQPIDRLPFTVAAYTPLYYWLAAGLHVVVGDGFGSGRALSLLAGVLAAALVGFLAAQRQRALWVGALAGALFVARGFPGDVPWLGLYRVDLLGIALSLASVALLSRGSTLAAGVLAGLAVLTKQTFIAATIAGTVWQYRDPRRATAFLGSAVLTCAIPCLLLTATTNGAFLENTFAANLTPFSASIALGLAPTFLEAQWLPLLLAGAYLVMSRPWRATESRLLVLYWGLSSLPLLGMAKVGANHNYWIEFAATTAILAARGAACAVSQSRGMVAAAGATGLILALIWQVGGPPGALAAARSVRADLGAALAPPSHVDFDNLVGRVQSEPRGVLAEPMDVLVLAGRPVELEPFIYNLLLQAGRWRPDPLVARICTGQIGLLVLAYPLERAANMTDGLYALWPAPVIAALQDTMALDDVQATRYVYARRQPCTGAG